MICPNLKSRLEELITLSYAHAELNKLDPVDLDHSIFAMWLRFAGWDAWKQTLIVFVAYLGVCYMLWDLGVQVWKAF